MYRPSPLAALTATAAALAMAVAGTSTTEAAGPPKPPPPNRVVIVLFDQMLPQYADQFAMPNFRSLRELGHQLQEGLPRLHGLGDRDGAQRDHLGPRATPHGVDRRGLPRPRQRLQQGRRPDAHHRRRSSASDFALIEKNNGVAYDKLADYLHTAYPNTEFITVGEKSYAVESATGGSGDIAVRLSSRRSNVTSDYPAGCRNLRSPARRTTGGGGGLGKNVPVLPHEGADGSCAAGTSSTRTRTTTTGPRRRSRRGCTRSTATGSCPATTRRTAVVTPGSPTRR